MQPLSRKKKDIVCHYCHPKQFLFLYLGICTLMGRFGATETLFFYKGSLKTHSDLQESPRPHVCEFVNMCVHSGTCASTHVQVRIHIHTHSTKQTGAQKWIKYPQCMQGPSRRKEVRLSLLLHLVNWLVFPPRVHGMLTKVCSHHFLGRSLKGLVPQC